MEEYDELNEMDTEEIAKLIIEGNTSGQLGDGEGRFIGWELKTSIWTDK